MRTLLHAAIITLLFTPMASAQGEEKLLAFLPADQAFAKAAKTGKRVLVYQDWPG